MGGISRKEAEAAAAGDKAIGAAGLKSMDGSNLVGARARLAMLKAGGRENLSDQTQQGILETEHANVMKEVTEGVAKQIKAQRPAVSVTEARLMAEKVLAEELNKGAKILRDRNGHGAGVDTLGRALADQGKNPGGVPSLGSAGLMDFFRGAPGKIGRGFKNMFQPGNFGAQYALSMAAPMIGSMFDQGNAEDVAHNRSGEGAFTAGRVTNGTLSGAAMGLSLGMATGNPWGAAVGAGVGAVYGFAKSVNDASKELEDARLGRAAVEFGDYLEKVVRGDKRGNIVGESKGLADLS